MTLNLKIIIIKYINYLRKMPVLNRFLTQSKKIFAHLTFDIFLIQRVDFNYLPSRRFRYKNEYDESLATNPDLLVYLGLYK